MFKVRVARHNHHQVGQPPNRVFQQIDRHVYICLFFLRHLVFKAAHTVAGLAGDGALLIFAWDDLARGHPCGKKHQQSFGLPFLEAFAPLVSARRIGKTW
jgi:hypothetical protein